MFIYLLLKEQTPFYVGRTSNTYQRLKDHKKRFGEDITLEILDDCDYQDSVYLESQFINLYINRGYTMANKHKGTTINIRQNKLDKYLATQKDKKKRKVN